MGLCPKCRGMANMGSAYGGEVPSPNICDLCGAEYWGDVMGLCPECQEMGDFEIIKKEDKKGPRTCDLCGRNY